MRKFDRYLLAQLTVLFGFFSLVLISVYWVNRAVLLFDQLIGDGQSALVFLEFTALALPNVIRLVLPVSGFAATVYVVNRLISESELVVVQAMGFSSFRLARPVLVFGLMVAALVMVLNHFLVPASRAELAVRKVEIAENITARLLTEGQFLHPAEGVTFYIRDISTDGELRNVFLSDARSASQRTTYTAERALLVPGEDGPKLVMFDGLAQTLRYNGNRLFTTSFADSVYDLAGLIDAGAAAALSIEALPTPALLFPTEALMKTTGKPRAAFLYEGHARIAQPFLGVAGALIGFSALMLGSFSRFGIWKQVLLAVVLLIGLQLLDNATADIARRNEAAWPVVYLPPVAGIAMAWAMLCISACPTLFARRRRVAA
ncbi:LPS export ABC transporter permease LptF [Actibacterium sp. MT2.3-13A]|uniref:LPS export ABC transporter permease LptF n=1 Tax=Actibacterium sp. MT2.3-13A TaxID=2828332 RepID=UPI001BAB0BDF